MQARHGLPKTIQVRLLSDCCVGSGNIGIQGDVWLLAAASAMTLIDGSQAERILTDADKDVVEMREPGLQIYAESADDPKPKLISRLKPSERKPRPAALIPLNAATQCLEFVTVRPHR
jgi:hypothetical protein